MGSTHGAAEERHTPKTGRAGAAARATPTTGHTANRVNPSDSHSTGFGSGTIAAGPFPWCHLGTGPCGGRPGHAHPGWQPHRLLDHHWLMQHAGRRQSPRPGDPVAPVVHATHGEVGEQEPMDDRRRHRRQDPGARLAAPLLPRKRGQCVDHRQAGQAVEPTGRPARWPFPGSHAPAGALIPRSKSAPTHVSRPIRRTRCGSCLGTLSRPAGASATWLPTAWSLRAWTAAPQTCWS